MTPREPVSPALKQFMINMVRETMFDAGYTTQQVIDHLATVGPQIDSLDAKEATLGLLKELSDGAFIRAD